jgi:hypothetical protein
MTTWRLWRALTHPPYNHPLFWRTLLNKAPEAPVRQWPSGQVALGFLLLFICSAALFPRQMTMIALAAFMVVPFLLLIFTFNGMIYGLVWGVKISTTIAKTYEASIFDVLSLSPSGALGALWAMGTGCLYRNREFGDLNFPETWTVRLFVVIFASMALGTLSGARRAHELALPVLVYALVLIAGFYVDDVQSIVLGSLVGMLTPLYAHNRVDARMWTMGLYLLIQVVTYLSALIAGFVILPAIYERLGIDRVSGHIALPLLAFAVFYGLRELAIALLWHNLTERLNADPSELNLMTGGRVS